MNFFPSTLLLLVTCRAHAWIGTQQNIVLGVRQGRRQIKNFNDRNMRSSTRTSVILKDSSNKRKLNDDDDGRISNRDYYSLIVASFLQQAMVPLADLMNGALLYSQLQDPNILGAIGIARASQVRFGYSPLFSHCRCFSK